MILRHILLCAEYLLKLTIQDDDFADVWVVAVRCFVAFSFRRFVALLAMLRFVALVLPCCDVVMVSWCLCDVLRVGFFLLFLDCLFLISSSLLFFSDFSWLPVCSFVFVRDFSGPLVCMRNGGRAAPRRSQNG